MQDKLVVLLAFLFIFALAIDYVQWKDEQKEFRDDETEETDKEQGAHDHR